MDWSRLKNPSWRAEAVSVLRRFAVMKARNALLFVGAIVMLMILLAGLPILATIALARLDVAAGISDMQRKLIGMRDRLKEEKEGLKQDFTKLFA